MAETTKTDCAAPLIGGDWTDPLEDGVRSRVRDFIETILEEELESALGRGRYERQRPKPPAAINMSSRNSPPSASAAEP